MGREEVTENFQVELVNSCFATQVNSVFEFSQPSAGKFLQQVSVFTKHCF